MSDMQYQRLGRSGLQVSRLSLGSWVTFHFQADDDLATSLMSTAYDAGINFFDNAEAYAQGRSEEIMGRALKKLGLGRDTIILSSKAFWGGELPTQRGLSRKHLHDACHAAMKRLQVDYLDLYFCHRPDPETPIEETVRAMNDLIRQGKVLYWGTSEWSAEEIKEAHRIAKELGLDPPTMEQPEYNMFRRDRFEVEYADLYETFGMGTTIWSPLASGILTGKYRDGVPEGSRLAIPEYDWLRDDIMGEAGRWKIETANELEDIAKELEVPLALMSLAWCLKNPNVSTMILGASRVEQLTQNLDCLEVVDQLDDSVMNRIESVLKR